MTIASLFVSGLTVRGKRGGELPHPDPTSSVFVALTPSRQPPGVTEKTLAALQEPVDRRRDQLSPRTPRLRGRHEPGDYAGNQTAYPDQNAGQAPPVRAGVLRR